MDKWRAREVLCEIIQIGGLLASAPLVQGSNSGRLFAFPAGQANSVAHGVQVVDSEGLLGDGGHDGVTFLGSGVHLSYQLAGQWVWARVAVLWGASRLVPSLSAWADRWGLGSGGRSLDMFSLMYWRTSQQSKLADAVYEKKDN